MAKRPRGQRCASSDGRQSAYWLTAGVAHAAEPPLPTPPTPATPRCEATRTMDRRRSIGVAIRPVRLVLFCLVFVFFFFFLASSPNVAAVLALFRRRFWSAGRDLAEAVVGRTNLWRVDRENGKTKTRSTLTDFAFAKRFLDTRVCRGTTFDGLPFRRSPNENVGARFIDFCPCLFRRFPFGRIQSRRLRPSLQFYAPMLCKKGQIS